MKMILNHASFLLTFCLGIALIGCSKEEWNVEEQGIPRFVKTDYIELEKIYCISKFRSSVGHDYSDSFESCKSMKHYYMPLENINWSTVKIYSPVSGIVKKVDEESEGTQLHIESDEYPAFRFKIFHINMAKQYKTGDKVAEGEQLGTHASSKTYSDIAVSVREGAFKERLVSYFDVMTDNLFLEYMDRGAGSREDLIISAKERNSDPLSCDGEKFTSSGTIENWFYLQ